MTLLVPQNQQTQSYTAAKDRYLWSRLEGIQAGVVGAGDFKATQRALGANMSVDIAAGDAWIAGTDTTRQGIYMVTNDAGPLNVATDTNGAAWAVGHATLPRIDQVILRIFDTQDGSAGNGNKSSDSAQLQVVIGTATSGATLDNRNGATALPSSCIRLADVLVPAAATTVTTANIRDRRPWARGGYYRVLKAATAATSSGSFVAIDSATFSSRIECSGVPLRVLFTGSVTDAVADANSTFQLTMDAVAQGASFHGAQANAAGGYVMGGIIIGTDLLPAAGSHVFDLQWATGAGPLNLAANSTLIFEEMVRTNANNN